MRSALTLCIVIASAIGCQPSTSVSSGTVGQSAGAASAGSDTSAASSSTGSSTASSTGTTGPSSAAGTTGTSGGSSTGTTGARAPPVYVDGGYVRCELSLPTDGGEETLRWECRPGTYFCATDGSQTCAQCLSDSDCANYDLPTFDPARPHCDTSSQITGYQGFCQQCLTSAQCTGNPAGPYCDVDRGDWEAPIVIGGFEACRPRPLGCPSGTRPALGGCATSGCSTDADCAEALTPSQQLAPFCVGGACAVTPTGNACPDCDCFQIDCGSPGTSALSCVAAGYDARCECTEQEQCGGAWPVCVLPPGGEDGGTCGCASDSDCGDGGLRCVTYPPAQSSYGGAACAVPCNDPRFPSCSLMSAATPICEASGGLCEPCGSDNDCQTKANGPSDGPFCRLDGVCGCVRDGDCPKGQTCQNIDVQSQAGALLGACALPPPPCTTQPCLSGRCDADSGACVPGCLTNEDCWDNSSGGDCDPDSGSCGSFCRDDTDCAKYDYETESYFCDATTRQCVYGCASDADCVGNTGGPHCISPGPGARCGCGSDVDCAGNPNGSLCDTIPDDDEMGYCLCADTSDCPAGEVCAAQPGQASECTPYCYYSDGGCPSGFFCDPTYACRPRCDPGHACQAPDPICDVDDIAGQNSGQDQDGGLGDGGDGGSGSEVIWCYGCLGAGDCDGGLACTHGSFTCGPCSESQDCPANEVCLFRDEACHALCDGGACPAGGACDVGDVALQGPDICYQCLSPSDCPDGQGCNARYHTCGTCSGPNAENLRNGCQSPYESCSDCPPDDVCSNYWFKNIDPSDVRNGVCLRNCDFVPCPQGETCQVLPELTSDHAYCFGCLTDADCADAGPGAWCDNQIYLTFTCKAP